MAIESNLFHSIGRQTCNWWTLMLAAVDRAVYWHEQRPVFVNDVSLDHDAFERQR